LQPRIEKSAGKKAAIFTTDSLAGTKNSPRRLRIAYIIPSFCPSHGGEQRDAYDAATGLAELGCDVTVFTCCAYQNDPRLPKNLKVTVLNQSSMSRHLRHWHFLNAAQKIIPACGPWDIVQGFCRSAVGNVYRIGGGTHRSYQNLVKHYSSFLQRLAARVGPKNYYYRYMEDANFRRTNVLFLANSERTKQEILGNFPVAAEQLSVIYPGVDTAYYTPAVRKQSRDEKRAAYAVPPESAAIAFVGSHFFRKGLSYALQACAQLKKRGIRNTLLVSGKGSTRCYLHLASRLGIAEDVRFLGGQQNTLDVLTAADLFILPSLYEPYGLAPLEAMACGIPVIVTKHCGIAELLRHGREGFLLDHPDSVGQAADYLELLTTNSVVREEMARLARTTAVTLNKARYCRELLDLYSQIGIPEFSQFTPSPPERVSSLVEAHECAEKEPIEDPYL
jgi:UDP-glucose:(heptosyl)LPS alpha-1,3-glucosyltransferase